MIGSSPSHWLSRLTAYPMVAFFVLGASAFLVYAVAQREERMILMPAGLGDALAEEYALLAGRAPTPAETETLVQQYVDDEILLQEALAENLHLQDANIKHRLVQKMRFILTDPVSDPSQDELLSFYAENADFYVEQRKFSFEQVYFETAPENPLAVLQALQDGADMAGDEYWLGRAITDYREGAVRTTFGDDVVTVLRGAPADQWVGPVPSERGVHFLRLVSLREPRRIPFAEIRDQVANDWVAEKEAADYEAKMQQLRAEYHVQTID